MEFYVRIITSSWDKCVKRTVHEIMANYYLNYWAEVPGQLTEKYIDQWFERFFAVIGQLISANPIEMICIDSTCEVFQ